MPSSNNRVIKANRASNGSNKAMIATEYELPKKELEQVEEVEQKIGVKDPKMVSIEEGEQLLKEAELKSRELIEEAKVEVEQMKKAAYESSYQKGNEEGLSQGYQKGYEDGYNEGLKKAELKNQEIREQAVHMLHEANEAVEEYEVDRKDEFLELATHMAEKIVHDYIDHSSDGVLAIAKPFFNQLDKTEEFVTISVRPDKREQIEGNLEEIKANSPGTRFMIVGNPSLTESGVLIESSHAVVNLQIRNQLDRMLEEIHEMERTVDA